VQDQANGEAGGITLSGGVAVALPSAGMTAERLYAAADRALYRAKNLGRNRIEVDPGTPGGEVLPGDMAPMSAGH
jgi:PleD family two-component response regulator